MESRETVRGGRGEEHFKRALTLILKCFKLEVCDAYPTSEKNWEYTPSICVFKVKHVFYSTDWYFIL